ncbi:ATP-grasp domain protein [Leptospira ryugenii]|uniref:ATP-grasp domain protein n=1 Tax=Leptospira ryugenii TaxID=1917863 RepID=A0A2P2DXB7_9LEPT|nr:ATP-grasp domain-containing protein [Leptospira ryugenii]GBF49278.1 ATP-grasp domain protein [Leptospira ryugenii]
MKPLEGSFLSLGAGVNQLPLIDAAKARGLHVIAVDKNSGAPGFQKSDIRILESTSEYRKILHAMSRVPYTHVLRGVGSRSFGQAIHSTAYLAEKFKLPGNPPSAVDLYLDKKKLKSFLEARSIPVPKSFSFPTTATKTKKKEILLDFPLVAKPASGHAKKGIRVLANEGEWKAFAKQAKPEQWILEQKVEGKEVTVLGMVLSGKFHLLSLTDKITTSEPPFIEIAHISPSSSIEFSGELKMLCQAIIRHTGIVHGPFVAEFKITDGGECVLIEAAPEVGGEFLADELLKQHFSYSYFDDLLSVLIGEKPKLKFLQIGQKERSAIFFALSSQQEKTVKSHPILALESHETLFFQKELLPLGTSLIGKEGNQRRDFVFGVSTSEKIKAEDWVRSLLQRMN